MLRLIQALLLLLLLVLPACSRPLDAEECNELLDHYTELLAKSQDPDVTGDELIRLRKKARARAAQTREFSRCSAKVPRAKWECAMKAPSVDEAERCLM